MKMATTMGLLESARRERNLPPPRPYYEFRNGERVNVQSRPEYTIWEQFDISLADGSLRPHDFSLREVFESTVVDSRTGERVGRSVLEAWRQGNQSASIMEAVSTSDFSNIIGQIAFSEVLTSFDNPGFIGDSLMRKITTNFLDGEKLPGMSNIGDTAETIGENKPYPLVGFGETFIETPRTDKNGMIVEISKEAVIADRTGMILQQANTIGEALGIKKEKRQLDTALGLTTSYSRNGGAAQATYGDTHTNGSFDNLSASTALVDYTDIEVVLLLFDGLADLETGEPVVLGPTAQLVCPSDLMLTARRIINATEVRTGSDSGPGTAPLFVSGNPLQGFGLDGPQAMFTVASNQFVKDRTSSASTWFYGDFMKAFAYMEVWPITVVQAPANNEKEFTNDTVARYKVSERGTPAVIRPWHVVKCTG